jgi:hypothetical protein
LGPSFLGLKLNSRLRDLASLFRFRGFQLYHHLQLTVLTLLLLLPSQLLWQLSLLYAQLYALLNGSFPAALRPMLLSSLCDKSLPSCVPLVPSPPGSRCSFSNRSCSSLSFSCSSLSSLSLSTLSFCSLSSRSCSSLASLSCSSLSCSSLSCSLISYSIHC